MNRIEHIVEPHRLWLVWRPSPASQGQTRRVVGEIVSENDTQSARLLYLTDSRDFECAKSEGFEGYPAFPLKSAGHTQNVLEAFLRRLPPRSREDFDDYLVRHRLPEHFNYSDMALLGYTGAKLPGDGFELCADLHDARPPFEVVFEVAGFRYQNQLQASDLYVGDPITFKSDDENEHDSNAVAIFYTGIRIGYLSRSHNKAFRNWLKKGYSISGTVERINGKPERPLVYIFVVVR